MYHILIAGGGYVGSRAAEYFRSKKQHVTVLKRTAKNLVFFESIGASVICADLSKPAHLPKLPEAHFVLICMAPDEHSDADYRKTYLDATVNLLTAMSRQARPLFVLYLSSTGVYGSKMTGTLDEDTIPEPDTERSRILYEAEKLILDCSYPSSILRLTGIYGPERNRISTVKEGKWPAPHPERIMNMIHRDDIIQAVQTLWKRGKPGRVYLGVDDEPVWESDFYAWLCKRLNQPLPAGIFTDEKAVTKRYTNVLLKSLGFTFQYPSFRSGYESLLTEMTEDL